jgi:hypothetical protein
MYWINRTIRPSFKSWKNTLLVYYFQHIGFMYSIRLQIRTVLPAETWDPLFSSLYLQLTEKQRIFWWQYFLSWQMSLTLLYWVQTTEVWLFWLARTSGIPRRKAEMLVMYIFVNFMR